MKLYSHYIIKNLFFSIGLITLTLTGLVWLTQSLRFVDLIVNRGLNASTFFYLSSLIIPSLAFIILPIATFCSVLFVYNKFISESEMVILSGAGLSKLKLAMPALMSATIVMAISYSIAFYFMPVSYREFKDTQAFIRNNYASALLQEGVFNAPSAKLTIYIDGRAEEGMMEGILVQDERDPAKPVTMMAEKGELLQTDQGPKIYLINGNRQQIDKQTGNLSILYFDEYVVGIASYIQEAEQRFREPEERYMHELFYPGEQEKYMEGKLRAEGHHRLLWPYFNIVLTLFAVTALFTGEFSRRGQWRKITVSVSLCIMVIALDLGLKNMMAKYQAFAILGYGLMLSYTVMALWPLLDRNKKSTDSLYRQHKDALRAR